MLQVVLVLTQISTSVNVSRNVDVSAIATSSTDGHWFEWCCRRLLLRWAVENDWIARRTSSLTACACSIRFVLYLGNNRRYTVSASDESMRTTNAASSVKAFGFDGGSERREPTSTRVSNFGEKSILMAPTSKMKESICCLEPFQGRLPHSSGSSASVRVASFAESTSLLVEWSIIADHRADGRLKANATSSYAGVWRHTWIC